VWPSPATALDFALNPKPEVGGPSRRILAVDRVGCGRETAAINRPQSRLFARTGRCRGKCDFENTPQVLADSDFTVLNKNGDLFPSRRFEFSGKADQ